MGKLRTQQVDTGNVWISLQNNLTLNLMRIIQILFHNNHHQVISIKMVKIHLMVDKIKVQQKEHKIKALT